jgi:3-isopropylmalate/(R)-2-methylmalate dehydratase small subunit
MEIDMEPLRKHTGIAAMLNYPNVDTDQIIPKQFLKRIERSGYEDFLFYDWRYRAEGSDNPDFPLNHPDYQGASFLVAGDNFGCGSSREHAVWALKDYGFRVLISTSFSDIFHTNCVKNGVLPIRVSKELLNLLMEEILEESPVKFSVDIESQELITPRGLKVKFDLNLREKMVFLEGKDEIEQTLQYLKNIEELENRQRQTMPWLWSSQGN